MKTTSSFLPARLQSLSTHSLMRYRHCLTNPPGMTQLFNYMYNACVIVTQGYSYIYNDVTSWNAIIGIAQRAIITVFYSWEFLLSQ